MLQFRQLWLCFTIIVIPAVIGSLLLPYFPIDETRYLSVAWEMKLYNSYIVPLHNALPYSHKPPLLFWLINLDWILFGVNEYTLRFIPMLFSLFNVILVYKIGFLLWDDEKIARYAALILSSTLLYLVWSTLVMFDIILTFWVLLAILGLVTTAKSHSCKSWLLVGLAIGGGLLTKGPVVLAHILPVALLPVLWSPQHGFMRRWYGWLTVSLLAGIAIVLIWLVPAALLGGDSYREAILWGQTVNRVANSFAHKRPFFWYLPLLPVLLLPWILFKPVWRGIPNLKNDNGSCLAVIWAVSTLVIFSCISGKQIHYLIPALPAFSLLMAKSLVSGSRAEESGRWRIAVPAFYCFLGIIAFVLPYTRLASSIEHLNSAGLQALGLGFVAIALAMFSLGPRSLSSMVNYTALSSVAICVVFIASDAAFFQKYDMHDVSQIIKQKQEEGYSVLHKGKYHGQYHFLGRLTQPLVSLESADDISAYAATREKVALLTYEAATTPINREDIYFQQPYQTKRVVLWNKRGILNFINKNASVP